MAEIYVPGAIDIMGAANQMMQFRNSQQAQQANALQMQYAAEDRARAEQGRKIAAGNALADQARKRELLEIYSNFGVTPAVTGQRGQSYSGTGVANDPYADIQNKLVRQGFASEAGNIAELQNKNLTGKKTTADIGLVTEQTSEKTADVVSKYITLHKDQLNSAPDYDTAIALTIASYTPGHPMAAWLAKNGVSQEQAVTELIRRRDEGIPFEETRALMARGATNAAQDAATLAQSQAAARSSDAAATSSLATAAKTKFEMDNPGVTIEDVVLPSGETIKVTVNSKTGKVERLMLGGETLAPKVTPVAPTDLEKLQDLEAKLRAANPNDPRLADVRNAIEKETTKTAGVTVNTGDTAGQTLEKKGSELIVANYASLSDVPQQLENFRKVKELIPQAVKFMGKGGTTYADAVSFLNNRLGTNISVTDANGNLASAREIEARLFQGILENLKKMDSQPTQAQQQALKDAIGQLQTEPDALARLVDAFSEPFVAKVKMHNDFIDKAIKRGDVRAEDYRIKLPETTDSAPKKFKWNASTGLMEQQ